MKGQIFAPKHCAIASPSLATPTWKIEYGPNKIHRGIVTIWSYWAIMYYLKISGQPQDDVVRYQYLTSPSILPMFPSELHFWCSSRTTAKNSVWRPCHAALQTPASSQPKCELEPQFDKRRKVTQGNQETPSAIFSMACRRMGPASSGLPGMLSGTNILND